MGITGGIGSAFLQQTINHNFQITGYYHKDLEKIDTIKASFPSVELLQIDLSNQSEVDSIMDGNYEGLLYVAGKANFSENIFDFCSDEFRIQFNINVYSFISIIRSLVYKLRKIIIVASNIPSEIKSTYHLTKVLQENILEILRPELNCRGVSVSIIKTDWVNTKMYAEYVLKFNGIKENVRQPEEIAKICLEEFQDFTPFKIIVI